MPRGAARRCRSRNSSPFPTRRLRALDELDLVAVRVLDERDHAAAELHRARLERELPALRLHRLARLVDVGHAERDVDEAVAEVVRLSDPVVDELDHRLLAIISFAYTTDSEH